MDFTREPVIETIITPKEGCKLAVRNSKGAAQEEYFVDAVEIVSFGNSFFFRSLERPKSFFVPVTDYEVLEVRETRMVLKNVGMERQVKIAPSQQPQKKEQPQQQKQQQKEEQPAQEPKVERKRERRRQHRRRRGSEEVVKTEDNTAQEAAVEENTTPPTKELPATPPLILEPPKTLISDSISKYREAYQDAFFTTEEGKPKGEEAPKEVAGDDANFPQEEQQEKSAEENVEQADQHPQQVAEVESSSSEESIAEQSTEENAEEQPAQAPVLVTGEEEVNALPEEQGTTPPTETNPS